MVWQLASSPLAFAMPLVLQKLHAPPLAAPRRAQQRTPSFVTAPLCGVGRAAPPPTVSRARNARSRRHPPCTGRAHPAPPPPPLTPRRGTRRRPAGRSCATIHSSHSRGPRPALRAAASGPPRTRCAEACADALRAALLPSRPERPPGSTRQSPRCRIACTRAPPFFLLLHAPAPPPAGGPTRSRSLLLTMQNIVTHAF
ncbi:MAG: hypothetical protein J3K34DRAFT_401666, partial [Monoraphidium minutum]